jgi:hypothetical protein
MDDQAEETQTQPQERPESGASDLERVIPAEGTDVRAVQGPEDSAPVVLGEVEAG